MSASEGIDQKHFPLPEAEAAKNESPAQKFKKCSIWQRDTTEHYTSESKIMINLWRLYRATTHFWEKIISNRRQSLYWNPEQAAAVYGWS